MNPTTLREQIIKEIDCDCEGHPSDHTYSRSTEQFADYVMKKLSERDNGIIADAIEMAKQGWIDEGRRDSLESLIEKCGSKFGSLERVSNYDWKWVYRAREWNNNSLFYDSDSPLEAVTKLLESLNKKENGTNHT